MKGSKVRLIGYFLAFGGALLLTALIVREGGNKIVAALAAASWAFPVVAIINSTRLFTDGGAWLILIPKMARPRLLTAVWIRWIGGSVIDLLPSARVGGDILTARLATIIGHLPPILAAGVAVINVTISASLRILVTVGVLLLIAGITGRDHLYLPIAAAGFFASAVVLGFYVVQRFGFFRLAGRLGSLGKSVSRWHPLVRGGAEFDNTLRVLYGRRAALLGAGLLWTLTWLVGCIETWVALFALGVRTSFIVALIVETAGQGVRSVLFIVPAGLGVFEGGMVMICSLFGISGDIALALSLISRAREALFSAPGLIAWQFIEARRVLGRIGKNARDAEAATHD